MNCAEEMIIRDFGNGGAWADRPRRTGSPVEPGDDGHWQFYCFASPIENTPLRMREGKPSMNFATASSP